MEPPVQTLLTPADVAERVRDLTTEIESRADEIASGRCLPADLVAKLKSAGVFRMAMPRAWGGPEMTLREQFEIYEMLGAADASVGWCAKIGSDSGFFAAFLDERAARDLYPDLDFVTAGQAPPNGRAERVPGGYRVSGRWTFGSGCTHADVMVGGCLVTEGGQPVMVQRGPALVPVPRMILAPASNFQIVDTWHSTGLCGSGSHDYVADAMFVPEEHTFDLSEKPKRQEPLYCYPGMFLAGWSGVPLGLARRAIDETIAIVQKKVQSLPPPPVPLRQRPHARAAIAKADMQWRAARAFALEAVDRIWDEAQREGRVSPESRRAMVQSLTFAFRTAREIAQSMYDLVGTVALFSSKSSLDRRLRDAITMSQHLLLSDSLLEVVGGLILGDPSPVPWL
jgi:alkylation response protein AidB-like acyl-CoA dehydrogenase